MKRLILLAALVLAGCGPSARERYAEAKVDYDNASRSLRMVEDRLEFERSEWIKYRGKYGTHEPDHRKFADDMSRLRRVMADAESRMLEAEGRL